MLSWYCMHMPVQHKCSTNSVPPAVRARHQVPMQDEHNTHTIPLSYRRTNAAPAHAEAEPYLCCTQLGLMQYQCTPSAGARAMPPQCQQIARTNQNPFDGLMSRYDTLPGRKQEGMYVSYKRVCLKPVGSRHESCLIYRHSDKFLISGATNFHPKPCSMNPFRNDWGPSARIMGADPHTHGAARAWNTPTILRDPKKHNKHVFPLCVSFGVSIVPPHRVTPIWPESCRTS